MMILPAIYTQGSLELEIWLPSLIQYILGEGEVYFEGKRYTSK
jgi:hypothetical protein